MKLSVKLLLAPLISVVVIISLVLFSDDLTQKSKVNITKLVDKSITDLSDIVLIEEQLSRIKSYPPSLITITMMGQDSIVTVETIKARTDLKTFLGSLDKYPQFSTAELNEIKDRLSKTFLDILIKCDEDGDSYSAAELYEGLKKDLDRITDEINAYSATVVSEAKETGESSKSAIAKGEKHMKYIGFGSTVFVILLNLLITTFLIRALTKIFKFLSNYLGKNDFTGTLKINRSDEIGDFARWINGFSHSMRDMILKLRERAQHLEDESVRLKTVSQKNSDALATITDESNSVESSSITLESSMKDISNGSLEITDFINSTAAATEELSSSLTDMNSNSKRAKEYSSKLQSKVTELSAKMSSLEQTYGTITEVVEQVTTIAKQTKLLSVNANVEAVRAGTAGKSFAVVAREVSSLADSSTKAGVEISKHLGNIHEETSRTLTDFNDTMAMIDELINFINQIAIMIQEQMLSAEQISVNNIDATEKLDTMTSQVHDSSNNSTSIVSSIKVLDTNLGNVEQSSNLVSATAVKLFEISSELESLVEEFTV